MGYTNPDKRIVRVSRAEKRAVRKLRRLADRREVQGEHQRRLAPRAARNGWWYA